MNVVQFVYDILYCVYWLIIDGCYCCANYFAFGIFTGVGNLRLVLGNLYLLLCLSGPMKRFVLEVLACVSSSSRSAEVSRLMDIIINSLYGSKDIFLRELLSDIRSQLRSLLCLIHRLLSRFVRYPTYQRTFHCWT